MAQVLYHFVPKNLEGDTLYPLNRLRERAPSVAEEHAKKYEGREAILERRIPQLDCLWNDVIHLSTLDIRCVKAIFVDEGRSIGTLRWFEIPAERLEPENTVIAHSGRLKAYGDFSTDEGTFQPFTIEALKAVREQPILLRDHIRQAKSEGRQPLAFVGVPHVLYRGTIDLRDIPVVEG